MELHLKPAKAPAIRLRLSIISLAPPNCTHLQFNSQQSLDHKESFLNRSSNDDEDDDDCVELELLPAMPPAKSSKHGFPKLSASSKALVLLPLLLLGFIYLFVYPKEFELQALMMSSCGPTTAAGAYTAAPRRLAGSHRRRGSPTSASSSACSPAPTTTSAGTSFAWCTASSSPPAT